MMKNEKTNLIRSINPKKPMKPMKPTKLIKPKKSIQQDKKKTLKRSKKSKSYQKGGGDKSHISEANWKTDIIDVIERFLFFKIPQDMLLLIFNLSKNLMRFKYIRKFIQKGLSYHVLKFLKVHFKTQISELVTYFSNNYPPKASSFFEEGMFSILKTLDYFIRILNDQINITIDKEAEKKNENIPPEISQISQEGGGIRGIGNFIKKIASVNLMKLGQIVAVCFSMYKIHFKFVQPIFEELEKIVTYFLIGTVINIGDLLFPTPRIRTEDSKEEIEKKRNLKIFKDGAIKVLSSFIFIYFSQLFNKWESNYTELILGSKSPQSLKKKMKTIMDSLSIDNKIENKLFISFVIKNYQEFCHYTKNSNHYFKKRGEIINNNIQLLTQVLNLINKKNNLVMMNNDFRNHNVIDKELLSSIVFKNENMHTMIKKNHILSRANQIFLTSELSLKNMDKNNKNEIEDRIKFNIKKEIERLESLNYSLTENDSI